MDIENDKVEFVNDDELFNKHVVNIKANRCKLRKYYHSSFTQIMLELYDLIGSMDGLCPIYNKAHGVGFIANSEATSVVISLLATIKVNVVSEIVSKTIGHTPIAFLGYSENGHSLNKCEIEKITSILNHVKEHHSVGEDSVVIVGRDGLMKQICVNAYRSICSEYGIELGVKGICVI